MSMRSHDFSFHNSSCIKLNVVLGILLVCVLLAASVSAQVLYGSLTGTVTDPSGAAVSGAQVQALEVNTGITLQATSDSTGIYRFTTLLPGTYQVAISAAGFSKQQTANVLVRANEVARVDAQLQVGKATENVTVTTEAPLLQTDKSDVHTDLTEQQISDLPTMGTQGRNFQSLLRTIPGAGLTAETNSLAGNPQRAINTNVNGLSNQSVNTRIDGTQDAYPWLPANVAYVPPANAIESVNVVTNSFDAEQGNAGGAAVNVQIKSGTNQFHGDVHEFHTDENFAARNYFQTDKQRFPHVNANLQNQYGGALGGPIKKDRLFFFADFERTTQSQKAGPDTRTLPTAAMAAGDFRNLPGNPIIYDPATGDQHGAGKAQVSCNGVLNVICPNRIDPAAAAMVKLLQTDIAQESTTANDLGNFSGSGTAFFNRENADFKIDYHPDASSTVFGRYSFSKTFVFDPPLLGPAIGDATNGGQLGNAPGLVQNIGIGATNAFTPSLLLDWNFGFTRQRLGSTFDLSSANGLNDLHIPGTNNAGTNGDPSLYYGFPGFQLGPNPGATSQVGPSFGNAQPANPFLFRDQQYVSGANISWIKGKHSLRGGIEWNHAQINHFQPQGGTFQSPRGTFQFNGNSTALQGSTPSWFNSWADFMLGLPNATGKVIAMFNPTALRWSQWAWYARDQWQVTPKLTVNAGVRWEYYPFGYSDNGQGLRVLNLTTGNVLIGGNGNIARDDGIDVGTGQFLPRVGAAYRLTPSTVIRAGYGMSADPYTWHVLRNAYPAVLIISNVPANSADFVPAASLTGLNGSGLGGGSYSVPTGIVLQPIPNISSGQVPLPTNISTTTVPNPFHRGYIHSFNFMVEQQLWRNLVFQTGYVGTRAIRPVVNMNANASLPGTGSAGGILSQRFGANYTATINELNPFKDSSFDSLQTKITYRMAGGSSAGLAWTWSKAIDYADNEDLGFLSFPDPSFWYKDRGPAGFDRTHNIELWSVLALPFGKGQHWAQSGVAGQLLGGWLIDPIVSYMSGTPFTVSAGGNLNANGSGQTADLVGHFHILNGRPPRTGQTCAQTDLSCHYFDPSAFAAPLITSAANAHYGNTNRDEFRGPGYFNMNLSVLRDFRLTERFTLEVRADVFSLTNTPHFANPALSCPGNAAVVGSIAGEGGLCNTGSNNNFGVITGTVSPGGFFGPDPGNRTMWFGATVKF
ncbi:MAG TPA: TonB-dependent receptor [Terriglobales bacterium]|nr:TonB-dependent receptor [Terriglobales bacterium]